MNAASPQLPEMPVIRPGASAVKPSRPRRLPSPANPPSPPPRGRSPQSASSRSLSPATTRSNWTARLQLDPPKPRRRAIDMRFRRTRFTRKESRSGGLGLWYHHLEQSEAIAAHWLKHHRGTLLRIAIGSTFLWFGIFNLLLVASPAESLAGETILTLSFGAIDPGLALRALGLGELLLGLGLILGRAPRVVLGGLCVYLIAMMLPLFLFPDRAYLATSPVLHPQFAFVLKNVALMAGALLIGSTLQRSADATAAAANAGAPLAPQP